MSRRPGSPGGQRKRGLTPIIWIALISVSGVLVLTGAHLALGAHSSGSGGGSSGGRGGGSGGSERVPRLLLQGNRRRAGPGALQQHELRPDAEAQLPDEGSKGSSAAEAGAGGSSGSSDATAAATPAGGSPAANGPSKDRNGELAAAAAAGSADAAEMAAGAAATAAEAEAAAAAGAAPELPQPPAEQLGPGSDLSTFAAAGTHCEVTPQHGKVALLFLTHGDLPHEFLWTAWMREARGLLPRSSLAHEGAFCLKQCDDKGNCVQQCGRAAACNPLCLEALHKQHGPGRSPAVLQQQHLFSVYVHARPTLKDYKEPSVFSGRLIPDRTLAKPCTPAMAAAAKKLLEAAVLDQRNEWFVLVGDTTVPLYHPAMMWQQLMHEGRSRVDACWHKDPYLQRRRYSPALGSDRFKADLHWRKSSQWFVLNRKHADLVAHDQEVAGLFRKHCTVGWDEKENRQRECISDEHYIPSLLAMHGLDNETTCDMSGGTAWNWQPTIGGAKGSKQARTFQPGHVSKDLIASLRRRVRHAPDERRSERQEEEDAQLCSGWAAATQAAQEAFIRAGSLGAEECPTTLGSLDFLLEDAYQGIALDNRCPLLARKFSGAASKWVHRVYRSCSAGLGVLPCSQKLTERDNHWWS